MTEYHFVTATASMKDVVKAVGIPTAMATHTAYPQCPFVVGDFISYPAAPSLCFRVAWRLYSHASASRKPTIPCWDTQNKPKRCLSRCFSLRRAWVPALLLAHFIG
jgi:hypothetical protein